MRRAVFVCGPLLSRSAARPRLWALMGVLVGLQPPISAGAQAVGSDMLSVRDYSFGYWLNGMRQQPADKRPRVLCFESGYAGLSLDLSDFSKTRFGLYEQPLDYAAALATGAQRLRALPNAALRIELESKGRVFRAVSCEAGVGKGKLMRTGAVLADDAWLMESGRMAQHYRLHNLNFKDANGVPLATQGTLSLMMWPQSLTLTAALAPSAFYLQGWHVGVANKGLCVMHEPWVVPHDDRLEAEEMTVEAWVKLPQQLLPNSHDPYYLLAKNGHSGHTGNYSFSVNNSGKVRAQMKVARGPACTIKQRGAAFKLDAWNHLAMTYDGHTLKFYINGEQQGAKKIDKQRKFGKGSLYLSQRGDGRREVTQAIYDEVRVWGRALSAPEIQAHAQDPTQIPDRRELRYQETFDHYPGPILGGTLTEWNDVTLRIGLQGADGQWQVERHIAGAWRMGELQTLSLPCDFGPSTAATDALSIEVNAPGDAVSRAVFKPKFNAHVAEVERKPRDWAKNRGYSEVRNYDEFEITVTNRSTAAQQVPFLLHLRKPANITGLCPILCDADGQPTGIPVQLSKNWHYPKLGKYFRGYMQLPAKPGRSTYLLRVAYGFYGSLPSASHAQLSLVGYAGFGRWDQLAIGCWGETMCFDLDLSCVEQTVTDVRLLMARNGKQGKKWEWTDAGWGGDWLGLRDANGRKLLPNGVKTAYLAHGPCLTEVRYDGHYGARREVAFEAKLQTLRTDDYARTLQSFVYNFERRVDAQDSWLFKIGQTGNSISPQIAYGNGDGLLHAEDVPSTLRPKQRYVFRRELIGAGPWWVGFPGGYLTDERDWGTGSRALIIRAYRAQLGGKTYHTPSFSLPVLKVDKQGGVNLDLSLTVPQGVSEFLPGDRIEMELEWITLHREADDYYGPNQDYRDHLEQHPRSWRTIYREAAGNDLQVQVTGGQLLQRYPVVVEATAPQVRVQIDGGCGYVPLRFEGLPAARGYQLYQIVDGAEVLFDQSVHGNDFWQTDYDASTQRYMRTYNVPLEDASSSEWLLRAE